MARYSKIHLDIEGGALARYLAELNELELLTPAEEQELAYRVQEGDEEAKARLIQANLRFVVTIAKEYRNLGMPLSDLISEGNLGLIEAVGRFDPRRGFKLISYAVWWIRHAILSALADCGRVVRMPQNRTHMLQEIFKTSRNLEQKTGQHPSSTEIAKELQMAPERVDSIISGARWHQSLDAPVRERNGEDRSLLDFLSSEDLSPEEEAMDVLLYEEIQDVLETLDEREAEVIRLYFGIKGGGSMTLDEIAQEYGITRERVRQIKEKALKRLGHPVRGKRLKELWEES